MPISEDADPATADRPSAAASVATAGGVPHAHQRGRRPRGLHAPGPAVGLLQGGLPLAAQQITDAFRSSWTARLLAGPAVGVLQGGFRVAALTADAFRSWERACRLPARSVFRPPAQRPAPARAPAPARRSCNSRRGRCPPRTSPAPLAGTRRTPSSSMTCRRAPPCFPLLPSWGGPCGGPRRAPRRCRGRQGGAAGGAALRQRGVRARCVGWLLAACRAAAYAGGGTGRGGGGRVCWRAGIAAVACWRLGGQLRHAELTLGADRPCATRLLRRHTAGAEPHPVRPAGGEDEGGWGGQAAAAGCCVPGARPHAADRRPARPARAPPARHVRSARRPAALRARPAPRPAALVAHSLRRRARAWRARRASC